VIEGEIHIEIGNAVGVYQQICARVSSDFVHTYELVHVSRERPFLHAAIPQDHHQNLCAVAGVGGFEVVEVVEVGPQDFSRRHGAVDIVAEGRKLERLIRVGIEAQKPLQSIARMPRILGDRGASNHLGDSQPRSLDGSARPFNL
jgi:hypothetical protein